MSLPPRFIHLNIAFGANSIWIPVHTNQLPVVLEQLKKAAVDGEWIKILTEDTNGCHHAVNGKAVVGWVIYEIKKFAQDRIADALEGQSKKEGEGEEWKT